MKDGKHTTKETLFMANVDVTKNIFIIKVAPRRYQSVVFNVDKVPTHITEVLFVFI